MGYESIAHEAEGYEGERNNCFSKILLVGQKKKSRLDIFRKLKLDINPFLLSRHYKYGGRFSLLLWKRFATDS